MITVSLDFMPAFYTRRIGLKWGEGYYFDPVYRAQVEMARERFLYDILGHCHFGSPDPQPQPSFFIQPVDLFMRTQGADWRFPDDGTVESWGQPWRTLEVAEIERIDPREAAAHPVIDAIIRHYGELRKVYGDQADVLGLRSGLVNIHGPYTTAHQLMGEELFMLMADSQDGAARVFAKVWSVYQAILGRIASAISAPPPRRVVIGDCAASMISADLYRRCVLPADQAIAAGYPDCVYHSCGPSSHLVGEFARLPNLGAIQLGPGTDLETADRCLSQDTQFQPLVDPLLMRNATDRKRHV